MNDPLGQGNVVASGLALGAGYVEGQQIERRHNELLRALHANQISERQLAYIGEMEEANRKAEELFYQQFASNQQKDKKIAHLEGMLASERDLNSRRADVILTLQAMLTDSDKSAARIVDSKNRLIDLKEQLVQRSAEMVKVAQEKAKASNEQAETAMHLVDKLRGLIASLKEQIAIMDRRHDRLVKLHASAEMKARTWHDQLEAMHAERDEYQRCLEKFREKEALEASSSFGALPAPRF